MATDMNGELRIKSTPAFKLKDKAKRSYQVINLEKQFGFLPEYIIVEKVHGMNNGLVVRGVLTDEEKAKEDKVLKELEKKNPTLVK